MLQRMLGVMAREPFYSSGTHVDETSGLRIGWVAHRGSFADGMPFWNERRDVCLFFAGEHFDEHSASIRQLKSRGHACETSGAGYLVHLYEEQGIGFLEKLNGWFSGVLLDLRTGLIVLFNDRYGIGRIYYHEGADGFYFSSEAKALLRVLPNSRAFDERSLGEFFSCGCALENRSLFSGISLLPGGSAWTLSAGSPVRKDSYFRPETWESQPALDPAGFREQLRDTFARILPWYFGGDQKVGVSLTGGVDSRILMAWANRPAGSLPCYTFGGTFRECADVRVARQVARTCGQTHQVIRVGEEFLAGFPKLAEEAVYFSDGTMDVSGAAEVFVNRVARGIAPVRLTGNYGGEILRSLVAFKPYNKWREGIFDPAFGRKVEEGAQRFHEQAGRRDLSFIAFKQVPWHHYSRLSVELSLLTVRSPYLDNNLVSLVFRAPPELATVPGPSLQLIADGNLALSRIGTDRGVVHRALPLIGELKRRFHDFTAKAEYAYDYGMPDPLAKVDRLLGPLHLERLFLGRQKFYHFRYWYRHQLAGYLKETLLDPRALGRPYINPRRIEAMVIGHTRGSNNFTTELHRVLSLELIYRTLLEPRS